MLLTYGDDIKSYLDLIPCFVGSSCVNYQHHMNQVKHKCSNDPTVVRQEVDTLRKVHSG